MALAENPGVARAVVLRAVEMAHDEEARRIFVTTEEEDWPQDLYARLGFDALGTTWEFVRSGARTSSAYSPSSRAKSRRS